MSHQQSPWREFKEDPNPLARVREMKEALPDGPGLGSLYREAREHRTVLGIPVLRVGKNLFVPRQRVVEKIEGCEGQEEE